MLKSLSIRNYAIIDLLDIEFESGFSAITGETGAGKSIIMGALGLVLGQRADSKVLKDGADKCLIEACFEIESYQLESFFEENDLDYDSSCIFRREILSNGKSRAFVNDTPASLAVLKELGDLLIDIHSQHENLLLKDFSFQLKVVDTIAKNDTERKQYQECYNKLKQLKTDLAKLIDYNNKNSADKEYIEFQLNQLQSASLKENEQEELEKELKQLNHAEEIKTDLNKILSTLNEEQLGVLSGLKESILAAKRLSKYLSDAKEIEERINSCFVELKDISNELEIKENNIEYDPLRIDYLNTRLDLIYTLQKKHNLHSNRELLEFQTNLEQKLNNIGSSSEQVEELTQEIITQESEAVKLAEKLSLTREKASENIAAQITKKLMLLGMPKVKFEIAINSKKDLTLNGSDQIEFLFSANEKMSLQAITQIASGGEIARVMLSIKSLLAKNKTLPTIIFDEIDTGISGEIADKMAGIMKDMGSNMQVLTITHLPQIAAKGESHFKVFKDNSTTNIKKLSTTERVAEIAQMLSGSSLTEAAIANAKELLSSSKS